MSMARGYGSGPPLMLPVDVDQMEDYPIGADDRLDSHWFMAWERRRWLNSDMRLRGTPECRALYFDLICISFDGSPTGTLPCDHAVLARMVMVPESHFETLCRMEFGPLHNWIPVRCDGEVRLAHSYVLRTITEALSRKEDHRARAEGATEAKRLQRLRSEVASRSAAMGKDDAAILWMNRWLNTRCKRRSDEWIERAMQAWLDERFDPSARAGGGAKGHNAGHSTDN